MFIREYNRQYIRARWNLLVEDIKFKWQMFTGFFAYWAEHDRKKKSEPKPNITKTIEEEKDFQTEMDEIDRNIKDILAKNEAVQITEAVEVLRQAYRYDRENREEVLYAILNYLINHVRTLERMRHNDE